MASVQPDTLKNIALTNLNNADCHTFIRQVNDCAIDCDKQFDDEWQADVAGMRMFGDALQWYTEQDENILGSWKMLKKALVRECKARSLGDPSPHKLPLNTFPPASSPSIPTPAAAPNSSGASGSAATKPLFGRIRVEATEPQYSGYLSSGISDGCVCVTAQATSSAMIFKFGTQSDYPLLKISNSDLDNPALGIHWAETPDTTHSWGRLVIISTTDEQRTSSWKQGTGSFVDTAFLLLQSLSIIVADPSAGPFAGHPLDTYVRKSTRQIGYSVSYSKLVAMAASRGNTRNDLCSVKLIFEPW